MLAKNDLQFAVVREDPAVELALFRQFGFGKAVLIGSGGCTLLSLAGAFPEARFTVIEPNPTQLRLIDQKIGALKRLRGPARAEKFGLGREHPGSLIEAGNFETLFRGLRGFVFDFVASRSRIAKLLESGTAAEWREVFAHRYWPVAFELYFANALLETMFGPAAIQHAPPNSYPAHFRAVLERGLLRADRRDNYFLHHILLGHYPRRKRAWPPYLQSPPANVEFERFAGLAQDLPDYAPFDFVDLSNIFDWSSEAEVRALVSRLSAELRPGACVLYRQLNHGKDFRPFFAPSFTWLDADAKRLHEADRSLFYSSLHLGRKIR